MAIIILVHFWGSGWYQLCQTLIKYDRLLFDIFGNISQLTLANILWTKSLHSREPWLVKKSRSSLTAMIIKTRLSISQKLRKGAGKVYKYSSPVERLNTEEGRHFPDRHMVFLPSQSLRPDPIQLVNIVWYNFCLNCKALQYMWFKNKYQ